MFVLTGDGRVLVPPSVSGQELRSLLLKRPEDLSMPLLAEEAAPASGASSNLWSPFSLRTRAKGGGAVSDDTIWGQNRNFGLVSLFQSGILVGESRRNRLALLLVTLLALGVATFMALYPFAFLQRAIASAGRAQFASPDAQDRCRGRCGIQAVGNTTVGGCIRKHSAGHWTRLRATFPSRWFASCSTAGRRLRSAVGMPRSLCFSRTSPDSQRLRSL